METHKNNQTLLLDSFGGTHQGRVRPINEDRFLSAPEFGVFLVADGMGGHSHGDIASSAIIQYVEENLQKYCHDGIVQNVGESIFKANNEIKRISENNNIIIGSTVAALVFSSGRFSVLWSGDSRVYRVRQETINRLTTDHTEAQMLLRQNAITQEEFENWTRKNVIVHAIGTTVEPYIEVASGDIDNDDCFVLCSDGLTNHIFDNEIEEMASKQENMEILCSELIKLALQRGGHDNISVIAIRVTI